MNCSSLLFTRAMSASEARTPLNNGLSIPLLGLGTFVEGHAVQHFNFAIPISAQSQSEQIKTAVEMALDAGYRHVDTAYLYFNEKVVGMAVRSRLERGDFTRKEIFITSKLWNTFHDPADVRATCLESLSNLGLSYLDLYLMHTPMGFQNIPGEVFPHKDNIILASNVDFIDTWKAMEKLVDEGLVKSIGVSNFNRSQVERLLSVARIKPVVNQVELHPYLAQQEMVKYCQSNGVVVTAHTPLGSPQPNVKEEILREPVIISIAEKNGKTAAQIILRYQVQRNIVVIPKSMNASRIVQNSQIFDFKLDEEEMQRIAALDRNWRRYSFNIFQCNTHPYFPFSE
uniref:1,5-anhydro-D-fructose reductase-like isoform X2 n=1 Tax=Myxine glutinosa TaxID=7769 RepID=UPI00358F34F4